jgi:dienelactone hydrolase
MITRDISYDCDGVRLTGYLADDDARPGKRPGVLLCHQGGGLTDHTRERARMLAELGYVAFALDMYGTVAKAPAEALPLMQALLDNPETMRKRALAGVGVLKAQANVDPARLAAIGYCFGGALVLEMARCTSDLACVVAFHPGMAPPVPLPDSDDRPVQAKVMVCAGADDPFIPGSARKKFIELMKAANADWQLLVYGGAGHSFTDSSVDRLNMPGFRYDAITDARSWAAMRNLFDECFGLL